MILDNFIFMFLFKLTFILDTFEKFPILYLFNKYEISFPDGVTGGHQWTRARLSGRPFNVSIGERPSTIN
jgi:hypothetical protein